MHRLLRLICCPRSFSVTILTWVLAASLSSCGAVPRYEMTRSPLHKDSVLLTVFLDGKAEAEVYRGIAGQEVRKLLVDWDAHLFPLYEVRFEFLSKQSPQIKFASIIARIDTIFDELRMGSVDLSNVTRQWKIYIY